MIVNCPMCGKGFEVLWPHLWAYKRNGQYICSWKCLRATDKDEGVNKKVERTTDTKTRNREAVQIALNGGNPLKFLEEHGCTNPSGLWYTIKQKVKEESPDLYAKLPKRIQRKDAVKKEEPEVSLADAMTGMQEAADEFFGACEEMGIKMDPPEEPKISQPVVYDGMTIREVEGLFGRYRRSDVGDATYIDLEFTDCCDVISNTVGQWRSFIAELDKAANILGVEL